MEMTIGSVLSFSLHSSCRLSHILLLFLLYLPSSIEAQRGPLSLLPSQHNPKVVSEQAEQQSNSIQRFLQVDYAAEGLASFFDSILRDGFGILPGAHDDDQTGSTEHQRDSPSEGEFVPSFLSGGGSAELVDSELEKTQKEFGVENEVEAFSPHPKASMPAENSSHQHTSDNPTGDHDTSDYHSSDHDTSGYHSSDNGISEYQSSDADISHYHNSDYHSRERQSSERDTSDYASERDTSHYASERDASDYHGNDYHRSDYHSSDHDINEHPSSDYDISGYHNSNHRSSNHRKDSDEMEGGRDTYQEYYYPEHSSQEGHINYDKWQESSEEGSWSDGYNFSAYGNRGGDYRRDFEEMNEHQHEEHGDERGYDHDGSLHGFSRRHGYEKDSSENDEEEGNRHHPAEHLVNSIHSLITPTLQAAKPFLSPFLSLLEPFVSFVIPDGHSMEEENFAEVCCADCPSVRVSCLSQCKRVGCRPAETCADSGRGAYAAFCQTRCEVIEGMSASVEFLPDEACRGYCSAHTQKLCAANSCKDHGCYAPECADLAPLKCL
eukprot:GHVS01070464.1.p1 GENE.GHVS01070464.1~~GHVS01070464.1.p1  ORF type:complete len:551 (-),score=67.61 GHVS01070464.1:230-1882(-)